MFTYLFIYLFIYLFNVAITHFPILYLYNTIQQNKNLKI